MQHLRSQIRYLPHLFHLYFILPDDNVERDRDRNYYEEDISMTQEELADDVRWEEFPVAPDTRASGIAPAVAKRA